VTFNLACLAPDEEVARTIEMDAAAVMDGRLARATGAVHFSSEVGSLKGTGNSW